MDLATTTIGADLLRAPHVRPMLRCVKVAGEKNNDKGGRDLLRDTCCGASIEPDPSGTVNGSGSGK